MTMMHVKIRTVNSVVITRIFFFSSFFPLYLYEKMDVTLIYCGNYFTIYVNQTLMLYSLNLEIVCQLFFSKTGKKILKKIETIF